MLSCKIQYPRFNFHVKQTFVATGCSCATEGKIVGYMRHNTSSKTYCGTTLVGGRRWLIYFKHLEPGEYSLLVFKCVEGVLGNLLHTVEKVVVVQQFEEEKKEGEKKSGVRVRTPRRAYFVGATSPGSSSSSCNETFVTSGSYGDPDFSIVRAWVTDQDGNQTDADFIFEDPGESFWSAQFPVLPNGLYRFDITGDGGGSDSLTDLSINSSFC